MVFYFLPRGKLVAIFADCKNNRNRFASARHKVIERKRIKTNLDGINWWSKNEFWALTRYWKSSFWKKMFLVRLNFSGHFHIWFCSENFILNLLLTPWAGSTPEEFSRRGVIEFHSLGTCGSFFFTHFEKSDWNRKCVIESGKNNSGEQWKFHAIWKTSCKYLTKMSIIDEKKFHENFSTEKPPSHVILLASLSQTSLGWVKGRFSIDKEFL